MSDPEIIPPSSDTQPVPSVTINQFIQLVNQHNTLPDGATLDRYSAEDKAWIKARVEAEQEARHELMHKLVEQEHAMSMQSNLERNRGRRYSQTWAGLIVLITIVVGGVLIHFGSGLFALGLVAVVMIPNVAYGIVGQIIKRLESGPGPDAPPDGNAKPN